RKTGIWIIGRQRETEGSGLLVYWSIGILALCLAYRRRVCDCVTQTEERRGGGEKPEMSSFRCKTGGQREEGRETVNQEQKAERK
ncbi:Hypothetical predicted protein, partial [Xyrichtys novacula]